MSLADERAQTKAGEQVNDNIFVSEQVNATSYALGAQKSQIRDIFTYACTRKEQIGADKVFDFSLGNPSVPAPLEVQEAICEALTLPSHQLHGYTAAQGALPAREAVAAVLCQRHGSSITADDLYLTCGAAASLSISLHALLNPGDEVMVIAPYFPEYKVWIEAAGATCVEVAADTTTFHLDLNNIEAALSSKTRAIILNSPNNPTGVVYSKAELCALAELLQAHCRKNPLVTLIADEPYRELVFGVEVPWIPSVYAATIVCYSYSKSLSLPGERIGWVLVPASHPYHDQLIYAVAGAGRALGFVCAPSLFQHVITKCAGVLPDLESYEHNKNLLCKGLHAAGYTFVEPQGAFYLWLRALEPNSQAFFETARTFELLPVPSTSFGCEGWVRLGFCVSSKTIKDSLPAWAALALHYS